MGRALGVGTCLLGSPESGERQFSGVGRKLRLLGGTCKEREAELVNCEYMESTVMYEKRACTEVLERDCTCKNKMNSSLSTCWNQGVSMI